MSITCFAIPRIMGIQYCSANHMLIFPKGGQSSFGTPMSQSLEPSFLYCLGTCSSSLKRKGFGVATSGPRS